MIINNDLHSSSTATYLQIRANPKRDATRPVLPWDVSCPDSFISPWPVCIALNILVQHWSIHHRLRIFILSLMQFSCSSLFVCLKMLVLQWMIALLLTLSYPTDDVCLILHDYVFVRSLGDCTILTCSSGSYLLAQTKLACLSCSTLRSPWPVLCSLICSSVDIIKGE